MNYHLNTSVINNINNVLVKHYISMAYNISIIYAKTHLKSDTIVVSLFKQLSISAFQFKNSIYYIIIKR